jgi:adenosylcobinamide-phosphate synthase
MAVILSAVILDYFLGDPKGFLHPVIFIGKLISFYERFLYRLKNKKNAGFILVLLVLSTVGMIVWLITKISSFNAILLFLVNVLILYTALSCKSLKDESRKVIKALKEDDLQNARKYLSHIVGRDTNNLSKDEILKAVVETVAENTIDGVIAVFFYMIIGYFLHIPAILVYLYKSASTLDSMVGYKNEKYKDFGFASAKLDDILNFVPARIGAFVMLISGAILKMDFKEGFRLFIRDRKKHSSPNSAHSESVVAGLLKIRLGGGNYYFGEYVEKPYIGDGVKTAEIEDVDKVYALLDVSVIIILLIFVVLAVVL